MYDISSLRVKCILTYHWHSHTFINLSPPSIQPDRTPNPADTKTIAAASTVLPHALSILNPRLCNTPCRSA